MNNKHEGILSTYAISYPVKSVYYAFCSNLALFMTPAPNHLNKIQILYQDEDILLVNKPSGLLSIQDGYVASLPHLRSILEPDHGKLWIVHRLDKETSGVILLARSIDAHRMMNKRFRERQVKKTYHGLVTPVPTWSHMVIQLPLKVNADRSHRTRVNQRIGKLAHTICRVLKTYQFGVLMEFELKTGITHQIRAHLRSHDLALFGDRLYSTGLPEQPLQSPRMMLHARSLSFPHPRSDKEIKATAAYPDDFREMYSVLRFTRSQDEVI